MGVSNKWNKMEKTHDVVGIGSALLDFIVEVDESFLQELGLTKGEMILIDEAKSKEIFEKLKEHDIKIAPGGSQERD